jgi:hypothetical protein
MSRKKLQLLRVEASKRQNHRCFYCDYPMWHNNSDQFCREHNVPQHLSEHLRCTAEHLSARQDNGQDTASNIVASCAWCNKFRHHCRPNKAPDPFSHRNRIRHLVSKGRGHPIAMNRLKVQPGRSRQAGRT